MMKQLTIYDEAAYDLSIDYSQKPPPPAFDEETQTWTRSCSMSINQLQLNRSKDFSLPVTRRKSKAIPQN